MNETLKTGGLRALVAFAGFMMLAPGPALAGGAAGEYSVGPQSVKVTIKSWGDDCGPKPKSYTTKGKGTVTVTEQGDHLVFSNGRSTQKCWSANPKLQRLSVTKKGNSWTIVCESPATDSRYEYGTYVVTVSGDKITVKDTSKYNWKLKESVCEATIVIQRSFTKLGGEDEPVDEGPVTDPPPPVPTTVPVKSPDIEKDYPEPPEPSKCKKPGAPVKFVILPTNAKTTPGRKVCFTAYEVDKNGCRTSVEVEFKLVKENPDRAGRMDGSCFVPGDSAADSEGKFRVMAEHGYDSAQSRVVVLSAFIEDLIAVNLDPVDGPPGEGDGAGPDDAPATQQIDVPLPGKKKPPVILLYVLPPSLLALVIMIVVVVAVHERKKKLRKKIEELEMRRMSEEFDAAPHAAPHAASHAAPRASPPAPAQDDGQPSRQRRQAHIPRTSDPSAQAAPAEAAPAPASVRMICRVCGREFHGGSRFCPHDGSTLVSDAGHDEGVHESGMICPRCGRGYSPGTRNCGEDGELLVPASVADAGLHDQAGGLPRGQKKICPVCSQVYGDQSTFCGKDGVKLVPMN